MHKLILSAVALVIYSCSFAQLTTPQLSPRCTIEQTVGLTQIELEYSRPGVKGRSIFGALVPYAELWRLGANESTKLSTDQDLKFGDLDLPAGDYALYAIPHQNQWTIIVHKDLSLWGAMGYDEANDFGRFEVPVKQFKETCESFTMDFSHFTTAAAHLNIRWEQTMVSIPVHSQAVEQVEAQIKKELIDGPSPNEYASGARFYLEQGRELELALSWIELACKHRPEAFWYMHSQAQILAKLGRNKEAISVAEDSMKIAESSSQGDYGYVQKNKDLIKTLKAQD